MEQPDARSRAGPGRLLLGAGLLIASFVFVVLGATRADAASVTDADQSAKVSNTGDADASTGGNTAVGNNSTNVASNDQDSRARSRGNGDTVAVNIADTSNSSDGSASVHTGDASATGVNSDTNVGQAAAGGGGNNSLTLADQKANVDNDGDADADTGDNTAIGNNSVNVAANDQDARARSRRGDALAVNQADVSNDSNGSADITTGDADATGVESDTELDQDLVGAGGNNGVTLADQSVKVANTGDADADSGGNTAVGNNSVNVVANDQDARARSRRGDALAVNQADVSNSSDGSASVDTGNATATGVDASLDGSQSVAGGGSNSLTILDQRATFDNDGDADADSGDNDVLGNNSVNVAANDQDVRARTRGDATAVNLVDVGNDSDGDGHVSTGNSTAWGTIVDVVFKQEQA